MITIDGYLTGIGNLINVSGVTGLLKAPTGHIFKGEKRPDGIGYPCLTVTASPFDIGIETKLQVIDGQINIWMPSYANGAADLQSMGVLEAQVIAAIDIDGWNNGSVVCKSQIYRGSFGPFFDAVEADIHWQSVTFRSYMANYP